MKLRLLILLMLATAGSAYALTGAQRLMLGISPGSLFSNGAAALTGQGGGGGIGSPSVIGNGLVNGEAELTGQGGGGGRGSLTIDSQVFGAAALTGQGGGGGQGTFTAEGQVVGTATLTGQGGGGAQGSIASAGQAVAAVSITGQGGAGGIPSSLSTLQSSVIFAEGQGGGGGQGTFTAEGQQLAVASLAGQGGGGAQGTITADAAAPSSPPTVHSVGALTIGAGEGSLVLTAPSTISDNDILLASIASANELSSRVTWPSGWTVLFTAGNGTVGYTQTAWKRASGESGDYTLTVTDHDNAMYGGIIAISGATTSGSPVDVYTTYINDPGTATPTTAATTTTVPNTLLLITGGGIIWYDYIVGVAGGGLTWTSRLAGLLATTYGISMWTAPDTGSGLIDPTVTGTLTNSGNTSVCTMVAIKP